MNNMNNAFNLQAVKAHLRVEHTVEDVLIESYMRAAQDFAETFLNRKLSSFDELPGTVLSGLLLHVALLYEAREGEFLEKNLRAVRLLHYPHRAVPV